MEQSILDMLKGYVRIRITGDSYDRFLNLCAFHRIRLWDLQPEDGAYGAYIGRDDFKRLRAIVRKSRVSVAITQRHGLPFFVHRHRKRRIYVVGIAAAFALMLWLSAHIWNIRIEGNLSQTDDVIFEYLDGAGIRHGMRKSGVDCKALANGVRAAFPRFAWVAAELRGTQLVLHVKEGTAQPEETRESHAGAGPGAGSAGGSGVSAGSGADTRPDSGPADLGVESVPDADPGTDAEQGTDTDSEPDVPSSLVAARAGTVLSIYTRSGRPVVSAGDTVEKGDLLVSGALPILDDGGEVVSWQYTASDADVVIASEQRYYDAVPVAEKQKRYTGRERTSWVFRAGSQPFALPDRFGSLGRYELLSETTQCRLAKNFYLPLYLEKITAREYEYVETERTQEELLEILRSDFRYFKKNLEEKGVQLFENDVRIEWNEKSAIASGTLLVGSQAVRRTAVEDTEEELREDEYG